MSTFKLPNYNYNTNYNLQQQLLKISNLFLTERKKNKKISRFTKLSPHQSSDYKIKLFKSSFNRLNETFQITEDILPSYLTSENVKKGI